MVPYVTATFCMAFLFEILSRSCRLEEPTQYAYNRFGNRKIYLPVQPIAPTVEVHSPLGAVPARAPRDHGGVPQLVKQRVEVDLCEAATLGAFLGALGFVEHIG